eukprot:CAMPEP_0176220020 /NCGR_PEP_ID=MMETSP0121_2-20121125/19008_1 /TAXON_ID=160619 /ORGANISM="Kryptoperidinium foliaceum, Strain CCMP 1326" /LENGTH=110 /DNA_ID=CAMNT_0017559199 /DNA_START=572 /DNA_END=900 /DNA_ORIENTATION=-
MSHGRMGRYPLGTTGGGHPVRFPTDPRGRPMRAHGPGKASPSEGRAPKCFASKDGASKDLDQKQAGAPPQQRSLAARLREQRSGAPASCAPAPPWPARPAIRRGAPNRSG